MLPTFRVEEKQIFNKGLSWKKIEKTFPHSWKKMENASAYAYVLSYYIPNTFGNSSLGSRMLAENYSWITRYTQPSFALTGKFVALRKCLS